MLTAFKILHRAARPVFESSSATEKSTPDYYKILEVERFSYINTIKKQYKKLALTLHPDKNPYVASEEAFKLVGEAARVLSDRIRRKEYDAKLRIAMQLKAAEVELGGEGEGETFWTACSACRLLHQFERKYLGHNLMCPRCKKSFKAMEVEEEARKMEENEGVGEEKTRVSVRIKERFAKGDHLGIVEKCGLGVKRKLSCVGEVLERSGVKVARNMDEDDVLLKDLKPKRVEKAQKIVNVDRGGCRDSKDTSAMNESRSRRVGVEKAAKSGGVEIVESERTKRAKAREEQSLTLSQLQMLAKKKKKLVEGKLTSKEREANAERLKAKKKEGEHEKDEERRQDKDNVREEEKGKVNSTEKIDSRIVLEDSNIEVVKRTSEYDLHSEIEKDRSSEEGSLEVLPVEKDDEKEKEMEYGRGKRERRRVSKYGNLEVLRSKTPKNHGGDSYIEKLISKKKGNLEIMPVEDSEFHAFDKDRRERSFKKGQVWAVYDDDDGMPRHYTLIDEIVSVNPFEVTLSWLQFQTSGIEEFTSWQKRAARMLYRIYPKKSSVWAMYTNNTAEAEERNQSMNDKRCYEIVVSLSSYSDIHGLSIGYLEKVSGFRTVFKRREVGANAVICLRASDVKLFSHQIPAKMLLGKESSGLPKYCWELDPASLPPQLLTGS